MADKFARHGASLESPAEYASVVTPDDDNDLTNTARAIYVAGAGDLKVTTVGGSTVTFTDLPAASLLPVRVKRVHDTDTTATGIIALW